MAETEKDKSIPKGISDYERKWQLVQTILQDEDLRLIKSEPQKYLRNCGARSVCATTAPIWTPI